MPPTAPRVILIGFNKCGTSSLTDLFRSCGHSAAHWRTSGGQYLAPIIFANQHLGRPLLSGLTSYSVLSDLFYLDEHVYLEANTLFAQMAVQYPAARFLLNTRGREAWLASRMAHITPSTGPMIARACAFFGQTKAEVGDIWRSQWDRHHAEVQAYFASCPDRLLVYDIDHDTPSRIADWLGPAWNIARAPLRHLNKTAHSKGQDHG